MDSADVAVAMRSGGVSEELASALEGLARNDGRSLDAYMVSIEEPVQLPDTRATCRCHFVTFDGNQKPMVKELVGWLVAQAADYCIPRARISEAKAEMKRTGSTEPMARLVAEANDLFTKVKTSGEGGEMLLYLLLELSLGIPQLLCKMPLKSDEEMHIHGADGVHGRLLPDGTLALYWGESKLYGSVNKAIDGCLSGLAPFLKDTGGKEAKRDILLLRDHLDLDSPELSSALKSYFRDGTRERSKIEARGAALVGCSLADYAYPLDADRATATAQAKALLGKWRERANLKIGENELAKFELEIFFVPFPDVKAFRKELLDRLRVT